MAGQNSAIGTGSGTNSGEGTGSQATAPSGDNNSQDLQLNNGNTTPPVRTEADFQKANRQAAADRKALEAANKRLQELDDKDKSETQKATERAEAAERRLAETEARLNETARRDMLTAAVKGIALYPDLIVDKISAEEAPIDAATGKPDAKMLNARIAVLRTQYPGLFKAADGAADAGAQGQGVKGNADMNAMLRGMAGRG